MVGDVISYFIVAQDTGGNLTANPVAGFTGSDVNTVTTPTDHRPHIRYWARYQEPGPYVLLAAIIQL